MEINARRPNRCQTAQMTSSYILYSLNPTGFLLQTEIMRRIRKNTYTTCTALADTYISAIRTILFGVVSIAQLGEVTDSAVLGGVAEVLSSNPTVGGKIFKVFSPYI